MSSRLMFPIPLLMAMATAAAAWAQAVPGGGVCGEVVSVVTREGSSTRMAVRPPASGAPVTLLLLPGGHGHIDLDDKGCARQLKGNSLVRSVPLFGASGLGTALVDAPSDWQGEDGLGGYRIAPQHAQDLGRLITTLRARTGGAVWVVGTSRGAISAVNAASRLSGAAAPDGLVLTSALMAGQAGMKKDWVAHSVFDLPLEDIRQPVLVLGHASDTCVRSPPGEMGRIVARTRGPRQQVANMTGGPAQQAPRGLEACEGRTPHGFVGQEAAMVEGIARFVRGAPF
ncbi:hypothetical protein [Hydrogenophaga sp.]|uniref:hypothetical protein n=1 Tax=Hydrogenophaga sp. TaxID=1904254 RepID=UPI003D0BC8AB